MFDDGDAVGVLGQRHQRLVSAIAAGCRLRPGCGGRRFADGRVDGRQARRVDRIETDVRAIGAVSRSRNRRSFSSVASRTSSSLRVVHVSQRALGVLDLSPERQRAAGRSDRRQLRSVHADLVRERRSRAEQPPAFRDHECDRAGLAQPGQPIDEILEGRQRASSRRRSISCS